MRHRVTNLIEGEPGLFQSLPLGHGCVALWKSGGPIYAFNGTNQKVSEISPPAGYVHTLGRGADQTILVPTIRGLVYRYDLDGHLVEKVTLDIPMHLLAVVQLPDGRFLAFSGDRHYGLDVTPGFVLLSPSGKPERIVMQKQCYDPEFEVTPWGDVLAFNIGLLIKTGKTSSVVDLGAMPIWRDVREHDPPHSTYFSLHQGSEIAAYSKAGALLARRKVAVGEVRHLFIAHDSTFGILDQELQVHKFDPATLSSAGVQSLALNDFERSIVDVEHYDYRHIPAQFPSLFQLGTDQYLCVTGTQPAALILNSAFEQTGTVPLFEGGMLERICQLDNENFIALDYSGGAALIEFV